MLLLLSSSGPGDSGSVFLSGSVPHDQGVGGEVQGGRLQRADLHQGKKVPSPQHNTANTGTCFCQGAGRGTARVACCHSLERISQALETTKEQLSIAVTCDENHRFITEERLDYNFSVQLQHCRESMKKETKISNKKKRKNKYL